MTKANTRILGSAIALSLVMGAAGTAHAGLNLQGLNLQGLNLQGLNLQGLNLQGLNLQGVRLDDLALNSGRFANNAPMSNPYLWGGNQLRAYDGATLVTGTGLVGSTFQTSLNFDDGTTVVQKPVILTIEEVVSDTATNTMVCDPQSPWLTNCGAGYNQNYGVKLYKVSYQLVETAQYGMLCGGDQYAMLFQGEWAEDGSWSDDGTGKITVGCNTGVISKCARIWGYRPWKTMIDKYGDAQNMRDYHQACTRAARADYSGMGYSFTLTGMPIDIIDNGGFNVPASAAALAAGNFEPTERFESFFTPDKKPGSIKPDVWAKWIAVPRAADLPQYEAMYGYTDIDWDGESSKLGVYFDPISFWLQTMDTRHQEHDYGPEITVYNPVWSKVGAQVQSGNTAESWDHRTPTCRPTSTAPDRAFRWTAPQSGTYQFDTNGSTFDTVLYIYNSQVEVRCDDDAGISLQSLVTYPVTAGQDIMIFVDGYGTAKGDFKLNVTKL